MPKNGIKRGIIQRKAGLLVRIKIRFVFQNIEKTLGKDILK